MTILQTELKKNWIQSGFVADESSSVFVAMCWTLSEEKFRISGHLWDGFDWLLRCNFYAVIMSHHKDILTTFGSFAVQKNIWTVQKIAFSSRDVH